MDFPILAMLFVSIIVIYYFKCSGEECLEEDRVKKFLYLVTDNIEG